MSSWKLADHPKLPKDKIIAMIVLGGWGEVHANQYNCIHVAETPTMDSLKQVATGGADGILHPTLEGNLGELHEAIASIAAQPKLDEPEQEHILEKFHSSRIIRKLVLDCPVFASTLWEKALKGNCAIWAKGHSLKAFVETSDPAVKDLAKEELQPLIEKCDLSFTCMPMSRQEKD
ncbi:hypothetical protein OROGR_025285 [Orobanche gracilis]